MPLPRCAKDPYHRSLFNFRRNALQIISEPNLFNGRLKNTHIRLGNIARVALTKRATVIAIFRMDIIISLKMQDMLKGIGPTQAIIDDANIYGIFNSHDFSDLHAIPFTITRKAMLITCIRIRIIHFSRSLG